MNVGCRSVRKGGYLEKLSECGLIQPYASATMMHPRDHSCSTLCTSETILHMKLSLMQCLHWSL